MHGMLLHGSQLFVPPMHRDPGTLCHSRTVFHFLSKSGPLRRLAQTQTGKTLAPSAPGSHQDWPA
ncbi:hypothetical protein QBC41DRAFT_328277 [Cercophora samala]|uniref:Uncharacterized protein n=1 Tax=Cercophora samala TaxID=330535 RepID=A0AA39Z6S4_9PEZI|nr:hypothetical protein QBC41DRAFT_328277 [Cercophora samala]